MAMAKAIDEACPRRPRGPGGGKSTCPPLFWLVSSRRRNERVAARDNALERVPQLERLVREHGLEAPKTTMDLC